jgi:hypothetical protein
MTNIETARKYRSDIYQASSFIVSNTNLQLQNSSEFVWDDLEQLPFWVNWNKEKLLQLVNIAGTVFMLPSIRLWLESDRIEVVQSIIGKDVYDYLLKYTYINTLDVSLENVVNIEILLETTGASVLLSTVQENVRLWIINLLPETNKIINKEIAIELLKHALYVYEVILNNRQAAQNSQVEEE